jgi:hypothetical protein
MIERSGCNDIYSALEECLGEHDRDWRKCQLEVDIRVRLRLELGSVYFEPELGSVLDFNNIFSELRRLSEECDRDWREFHI